MLRLDTQNLSLSKRARLLLKYAMYPGTNWVSREKAHVVRMFLRGTPEQPSPHARLRLRQRLFLVSRRQASLAVHGNHDPRVGKAQLRGNAGVSGNLSGATLNSA